MRLPFRSVFLLLLPLLMTACAGPAPVVVDEVPVPEPPRSPLDGFTAVVLQRDALTIRRHADDVESIDVSGTVTFESLSPDGSAVVMGIGGRLVLVGERGTTVRVLSEGPAERVYTGAWSKDASRFHFGYYLPVDGGMGAGDIQTLDRASGSINSVGCSASKAVLAELPDGSLLVRNTDNLYQVEAEGCGTLRSVDARKMYHVQASPDGERLAYILRDLVFNREKRSYDPDSTLYIESTSGSDPLKIIGDSYSPRNLAWSSDGAELLYDVAPPGGEARRAVSIYVVADARSSYLLPPSGSTAATNGHFSPSGRHVLFQSTGPDGVADWQVKMAGSQFAQSIPLPAGQLTALRWVDDGHLLASRSDGSSHLISVSGGAPAATDLEAPVIWLWGAR